jgi:hypothetical protein
MRRIAVLLALLFATQASAAMQMQFDGGLTIVVCDDAAFTHYTNGGLVHGKTIPPGGFVITCPRTNAAFALTINGCPTHKVSTVAPGTYSFTC